MSARPPLTVWPAVALALAALAAGGAQADPSASVTEIVRHLDHAVARANARHVTPARDPFRRPRPGELARPFPVLPPNAGAAGTPLPPDAERSNSFATFPADSPELSLSALAIGLRPLALLESAGHVRVVTRGDRVGARRIIRITLRGIAFDDGTSAHLARDIR